MSLARFPGQELFASRIALTNRQPASRTLGRMKDPGA